MDAAARSAPCSRIRSHGDWLGSLVLALLGLAGWLRRLPVPPVPSAHPSRVRREPVAVGEAERDEPTSCHASASVCWRSWRRHCVWSWSWSWRALLHRAWSLPLPQCTVLHWGRAKVGIGAAVAGSSDEASVGNEVWRQLRVDTTSGHAAREIHSGKESRLRPLCSEKPPTEISPSIHHHGWATHCIPTLLLNIFRYRSRCLFHAEGDKNTGRSPVTVPL